MPRLASDPDRLRRQLARLEAPRSGRTAVSLGDPRLDAALPWGGLPRNGLHHVVGSQNDAAASGFALALAGRIAGSGGRILRVGMRHCGQGFGRPYGPGLVRFGVDPDRLILAAVRRPVDLLWTMEEGLRSGALAAVIGEGTAADLTAARRLQLAAEAGNAAALLLPLAATRSWTALTGWRVTAAPAPEGPSRPRWRVALERCRGGSPADWLVEWDDATARFRVVSILADRRQAPAAAHG